VESPPLIRDGTGNYRSDAFWKSDHSGFNLRQRLPWSGPYLLWSRGFPGLRGKPVYSMVAMSSRMLLRSGSSKALILNSESILQAVANRRIASALLPRRHA
jgi:hypothetical protein